MISSIVLVPYGLFKVCRRVKSSMVGNIGPYRISKESGKIVFHGMPEIPNAHIKNGEYLTGLKEGRSIWSNVFYDKENGIITIEPTRKKYESEEDCFIDSKGPLLAAKEYMNILIILGAISYVFMIINYLFSCRPIGKNARSEYRKFLESLKRR